MMLLIGRRRQARNKGFTFIELTLVAIIILILVGLSTPLFRKSFRSSLVNDTSQRLVQLMRYAQARAVAERELCRINFDFAKGTFWLSVQDQGVADGFKRIEAKWGKIIKVPKGISIKAKAPFITFYPDGNSDRTTIKISNSEGKTLAVTAKRHISYVQIKE